MARTYSEETKAAVMAALLSGQSVNQVAAQYQLPKGTVSSWRARAEVRPQVASDAQQKEMGELLLDYLRETLTTLKEQAVHFRNLEWLEKQSASELAVLHGVQTDKAIRLLEALTKDSGAE